MLNKESKQSQSVLNRTQNNGFYCKFLELQHKVEQIAGFIKAQYLKPCCIDESILALYGACGSGKTSVMLDIKNKLKGEGFIPVYFNAWSFEKRGNLVLSLFDAMSAQLKTEHNALLVIKRIKAFLKGLEKTETEQLFKKNPHPFKQAEKQYANQSSYLKREAFKQDLQTFEAQVLQGREEKRIIIFIDGLDRCEVENTLGLLAMLRLFLSYTKKSIYFYGLDKQVTERFICMHYPHIPKPQIFLEKRTDFSFYMPKKQDLFPFISAELRDIGTLNSDEEILEVVDFLKSISMTNINQLKKLFQKFKMLKLTKEQHEFAKVMIPDLSNVVHVIFVLYFIILHDFYIEEYEALEHYDIRFEGFKNIFKLKGGNDIVFKNISKKNIEDLKLSNLYFIEDNMKAVTYFLTPCENRCQDMLSIELTTDVAIRLYLQNKTDILSQFIRFILKQTPFLANGEKSMIKNQKSIFNKYPSTSEYKFMSLVDMANTLL